LGGGRGRVNPPPGAWIWRFGGFGAGSKPLHAERPEASADDGKRWDTAVDVVWGLFLKGRRSGGREGGGSALMEGWRIHKNSENPL